MDAILGLYSSPLTEAVADVIERHRMPMVANAAATSIFKRGRKFVFMASVPAERFLEGLIDLAANRGLKTVAVIHEDTLLPRTIAQGARWIWFLIRSARRSPKLCHGSWGGGKRPRWDLMSSGGAHPTGGSRLTGFGRSG